MLRKCFCTALRGAMLRAPAQRASRVASRSLSTMPSHAGLDAILRNSAPSPSRAAPMTPASPSAEVAREILGVHAREGGDESNFATAWWYAHPRAWQSAANYPPIAVAGMLYLFGAATVAGASMAGAAIAGSATGSEVELLRAFENLSNGMCSTLSSLSIGKSPTSSPVRCSEGDLASSSGVSASDGSGGDGGGDGGLVAFRERRRSLRKNLLARA